MCLLQINLFKMNLQLEEKLWNWKISLQKKYIKLIHFRYFLFTFTIKAWSLSMELLLRLFTALFRWKQHWFAKNITTLGRKWLSFTLNLVIVTYLFVYTITFCLLTINIGFDVIRSTYFELTFVSKLLVFS